MTRKYLRPGLGRPQHRLCGDAVANTVPDLEGRQPSRIRHTHKRQRSSPFTVSLEVHACTTVQNKQTTHTNKPTNQQTHQHNNEDNERTTRQHKHTNTRTHKHQTHWHTSEQRNQRQNFTLDTLCSATTESVCAKLRHFAVRRSAFVVRRSLWWCVVSQRHFAA